jgi:hypothetical protein
MTLHQLIAIIEAAGRHVPEEVLKREAARWSRIAGENPPRPKHDVETARAERELSDRGAR